MRILIADDNRFVRRGIIGLLAQDDSIKVCGEAFDSPDTIQKAAELKPNLIILDINMPGGNGLETARLLMQQCPATIIQIVTQHDPKQMLSHSMEVGASGCVDKARLAIDLLPMIRSFQSMNHSSH